MKNRTEQIDLAEQLAEQAAKQTARTNAGAGKRRVLLIVSGGIAAYKALELIRLLRKSAFDVTCILTKGGARFITPLSAAALSGNTVYTDLWSLKDETEMGHIRLGRDADLIVVAPASAHIMAKAAHGLADDLASTVLLAAGKPVLYAPAMNPEMWRNPAVSRNAARLRADGALLVGPDTGETACGESGPGRMREPEDILHAIQSFFAENFAANAAAGALRGKKALVTSGPTHEPIDPVRYIANRSSGKQGHAIARALARAGADVTLISGPVTLPDPEGVTIIRTNTAQEMHDAAMNALPADIAVCAAAVADWRPDAYAPAKIKKTHTDAGTDDLTLHLRRNPDILRALCAAPGRPALVVGFAAETDDLVRHAKEKRRAKGCDWILANTVGDPDHDVFGADTNAICLISQDTQETWPESTKEALAEHLAMRIAAHFAENT